MDDRGQLGSTRRLDNIGLNALYYRMEGVSCNIASILLLHNVSGYQRERERGSRIDIYPALIIGHSIWNGQMMMGPDQYLVEKFACRQRKDCGCLQNNILFDFGCRTLNLQVYHE